MLVRGAIFDLDGVLANSSQAHSAAWRQLALEEGFNYDEAINERIKGLSRRHSIEFLLAGSKRSLAEQEISRLAERKNAYYQRLISEVSPRDLFPGALETLSECRAKGIATALASSSKNAPRLIQQLDIAEFLDYAADANFIEHHKPHPEIFLNAAGGLGVDPRQCIAFEDSAAGIQAIKAAHMFAIGIGCNLRLQKADMVLESLADFSLDLLP